MSFISFSLCKCPTMDFSGNSIRAKVLALYNRLHLTANTSPEPIPSDVCSLSHIWGPGRLSDCLQKGTKRKASGLISSTCPPFSTRYSVLKWPGHGSALSSRWWTTVSKRLSSSTRAECHVKTFWRSLRMSPGMQPQSCLWSARFPYPAYTYGLKKWQTRHQMYGVARKVQLSPGLLFPQPLYPTGNGSHLSSFGFPSPQGSFAMLGDIWMVITLGREELYWDLTNGCQEFAEQPTRCEATLLCPITTQPQRIIWPSLVSS